MSLIVANRADSSQIAGGGVYVNGDALASWQPASAMPPKDAVVVADLAPAAAAGDMAAVCQDYSTESCPPPEQEELHHESTVATAGDVQQNVFPCATAASAAFPMACLELSSLPASIESFSGNVTCTLNGTLVPSEHGDLYSSDGAVWVLAAQDAVETFQSTPSPLPVRACALMRCIWTTGRHLDSAAGSRLCQSLWPRPAAVESGFVISMQQHAAASSYRVYPMASFEDGGAIDAAAIAHLQSAQGVDVLRLKIATVLNSLVLYGLGA